MFFRQIEVELEKWAAKPGRKPLILRGARQVGKSTVVHKFGKKIWQLFVRQFLEIGKMLLKIVDIC